MLWIQQAVRREDIELRKVRGDINPADLFTKHLDASSKLEGLLTLIHRSDKDSEVSAIS